MPVIQRGSRAPSSPGGPRARALLAALVSVFLFSLGIGSQGADVADITLGEGQTVERDYDRIPGADPSPSTNPPGRTPADCRTAVYCDTIDLTINVPPDYGIFDLYTVAVTLSWPNPEVDNMNLYLYDRNRTTQLRSSATANHPEKVELLEPPGGTYFLTPLNENGVNVGYKIKAEFIAKGRIPEPEEPEEPRGTGPGRFEFGEATAGGPAADLPLVPGAGPGTAPRAVESPGPDGPTTKATIATLGTARGFGDRTSIASMILTVIAVLIAAGFATVLILRHRRAGLDLQD